MSLRTVRSLIDGARARHWAFGDKTAGDGAALLFLRARLISHVATHGAKIEGLIGTSLEYTIPIALPGLLVTDQGAILATHVAQEFVVSAGPVTPAVGAPYQDGWPVHLDDDGVPYVDFSEPAIASDPFGTYGGTPGFPLPNAMVRLINVALVMGDGTIPCTIVPESERHVTLPGRNPACFASGGRLVPITATTTTGDDRRWAACTAIQISYVGVPSLASLDAVLMLPDVLLEGLELDLAHYFAMQSKDVPAGDKAAFRAEAARCFAAMADAALDLTGEPQESSVHYRG